MKLPFFPQAILFDAYGTLVRLDQPFERMQKALHRRKIDLPLEAVTAALKVEMRYYQSENSRGHDQASLDILRLDCARVILEAFKEQEILFDIPPQQMVECILESFVFTLYPEVPEVLEVFKARNLPLGVVGNWDFRLPSVLEDLGAASYFRVILASATAGVHKPDPRIFCMALEALKSSPEATLFIGDSYEKDILGARRAGLYPVLLNREGRVEAAVPVVRSLEEVVELTG